MNCARSGAWYSFFTMTKPRLIYFDAPVSRGEECRLALHLAGVDFEDVRINPAAWPAMKEQTPYGGLPVLELSWTMEPAGEAVRVVLTVYSDYL